MDYDEDYEIDTSSVFKQQASELATVTDLDGTLKKFGYAKDDRIERREMVLMYTAVEKDMEREIKRLASDTCFDEAKATRETLTKLRDEFCCLQTDATGTMLRDQSAYFEKAKGQMYAKLNAKHAEEQNYVAEQIEKARLAEKKKHDIQTENLEKAIARIRRPNVKYTKRMIELFKAESGYVFLCINLNLVLNVILFITNMFMLI